MLKEGSVFCDEQDKMIQHLIDTDDDQMLYNFRVAAGVDTRGALPMTGWDAPSCNLRGHTTGHYLSSLALGWSVTKKTELMDKIVYLIESLSECQNALEERGCSKGFLSAYSERQFDLLETYTPYPTIWAPYYTLDKIMSGLYDCYSLADSSLALNILCKMGDWVYERLSRLSRNQLDKMWSMYIAGEFGGMISVMVKLYTLTKKKTYLQTAYYFDNEKLFYPMQENIDTLKDMHANQHIPQIMGAVELYEADGSGRYYDIAKNFWNIVTASHVYSIGGIGETEMFHEPNEIMTYITDKTAESCASYNILRLTGQLFALEPERRKMDFYETVLYNHILSSFSHKSDGGTTYFMPLRPGGHKEFNTKENTCCHGSGLETRFRYVQDIYACNHDTLYINLYIPSAVEWENFRIEQTTASDAAGTFIFLIHSSGWRNLAFRIPHWAEDEYKVTINNQESVEEMAQDGYFYLHRDWREGDRIEILTPYHFRKLPVPDGKPYACMAYGPYILAALSDQEEYLPFPELTGDDRVLTASISNMRFQKDDVDFVPLAVVTNQKYHVYFEDCSHERHS
ncbi:beta-L-arabinofuranosidase domain-containing protein [Sediminispirochaeta smaragdinae]|nr:beta-L-arabinofuranosidase domain-containing protein [Sediminispirochaeta smaragdinae]